MARLLAEQGAAAITGGVVPDGVREVIRQRLDRVPAEARPLLELAAVAGDEIEPALLAAGRGAAPAALAAALADGPARGGAGGARRAAPLRPRADARGAVPGAGRRSGGRRCTRAAGAPWPGCTPRRPAPRLAELAHHALAGPPERLARRWSSPSPRPGGRWGCWPTRRRPPLLVRAEAAVEAAGNPPALRAQVPLALGEARIAGGDGDGGKALCREAARLARSWATASWRRGRR